MRASIFAVAAALALAACTIPSPSSISGNPEMAAKVEAFCAADFVTGNTAALAEWVMIYNVVAPLIDREPLVGDFTANETVQALLTVRSAICLATAPEPAPAVMEAVAG
jgi:hypothetical protein